MINKAYIILVHTKAGQLYRLIERLDDGHSFFFLHIDKNASPQQFAEVVNSFTKKIKLVKRISIEWGGFGLAEATIEALKEVDKHPTQFDWISLLSGQDYPIKSNDFINRFLSNTTCSAFIEYTVLPDYHRWSPRGGYYRLDKYFFGLGQTNKLAAKAVNLLSSMFPFLRRRKLETLKPYAGSQWWSINNDTLKYILCFIENHPEYNAFQRFTFAADEVYFHTIVLNAESIKQQTQNSSKRYIYWPDTSKPHPEILIEKDLPVIAQSDALFARKFDAEKDEKILDLIDERCLQNSVAYNA